MNLNKIYANQNTLVVGSKIEILEGKYMSKESMIIGSLNCSYWINNECTIPESKRCTTYGKLLTAKYDNNSITGYIHYMCALRYRIIKADRGEL